MSAREKEKIRKMKHCWVSDDIEVGS